MRVFPVDIDLGEHREAHAVVELAELADLVLGPWLLRAELVAGEAEHDETLVLVRGIQLLQPGVLRGETALARRVDDKDDVPGMSREVLVGAGEGWRRGSR